jgi:hypothetical protein
VGNISADAISEVVFIVTGGGVCGNYFGFFEFANYRAALVIAKQHFNAALSLIETFLTLARKPNAIFE